MSSKNDFLVRTTATRQRGRPGRDIDDTRMFVGNYTIIIIVFELEKTEYPNEKVLRIS